MFFRTHLFALSVLLMAPGCLLRGNTVIERFAGEFKCGKDRVTLERPDKNRPDFFRATGCNRRASYQCSGDYGEFCERIGQPETINPEGGALPSMPSLPNPDAPASTSPPKDKPEAAPAAP
jgi:hypothetical protein